MPGELSSNSYSLHPVLFVVNVEGGESFRVDDVPESVECEGEKIAKVLDANENQGWGVILNDKNELPLASSPFSRVRIGE
jgi:hypothetical protein